MPTNLLRQWTLFTLVIAALMALSIVVRVGEYIPNVAPIAALALFAGANLRLPLALLVPVITMFISDSIIGFDQIEVTVSVYASFIITTLLGRVLQGKLRPGRLVGTSLLSSTLFYLITNAAVWWWSGMYARSVDGLTLAYLYALPFFRNTLLGDMLFTTSIFLAAHAAVQVSLILLRKYSPADPQASHAAI